MGQSLTSVYAYLCSVTQLFPVHAGLLVKGSNDGPAFLAFLAVDLTTFADRVLAYSEEASLRDGDSSSSSDPSYPHPSSQLSRYSQEVDLYRSFLCRPSQTPWSTHTRTYKIPQNDVSLASQGTTLASGVHFHQTATHHGLLAEPSTAKTQAAGTRRATVQYPSSSAIPPAARYESQTHRRTAANDGNQKCDQQTAERDEVDYISEPPQYMVTVRSLSMAQYILAWDSTWEWMEEHRSSSSSITSSSMSRNNSNSSNGMSISSASSNSNRDTDRNYTIAGNGNQTGTW